ncbi:hypothetical protein MVG78_11205 [Roseomonas gilardii subsp. gilardii]|uniref:hypothetical protein n=1 Tax=Roseomonas gilardii TaxID=257708 RepID=UPI001FFB3AC6|nr:hypothetical protein [Roseomonas gilardii]UPG71172.1 hypothetical protein MVG78_11205 [Roseomonas gilardii subsp. gilardii]
MRFLFLGSTFRALDNLAPAMAVLRAGGHACRSLLYPLPGDASRDRFAGWAEGTHRILEHPAGTVAEYAAHARSPGFLEEIAAEIEAFRPGALVLAVNTLPFARLREDLRGRLPRPPLWIGVQHGLVQRWEEMNRHDTCDAFLAFGPRDLGRLAPWLRARARVAGLPKLDRLAEQPSSDRGFLLYVADARPTAVEAVNRLLTELEARLGCPVLVRDHPARPGLYRPEGRLPRDPALQALVDGEDPIPALAACSAVLTNYSTLGLEALALGKPLVSLPLDDALDAFGGIPGLSASLEPEAVLGALGRARKDGEAVDRFLEEAVGGRAPCHALRMARLLESLARAHRRRAGRPMPARRPAGRLPLRLGVHMAAYPERERLVLRGFVLADPPITRLRLRHGGDLLGEADVAGPRPDLAGAFEEYGRVAAGWHLDCPLPPVPGLLEIELLDEEGSRGRRTLHPRMAVIPSG